ncbi:MAG: aminotransferase class III-fold pyridoxal phosphate-dependent enzyme, partial [Candidatus Eisenbacteria bacterium]
MVVTTSVSAPQSPRIVTEVPGPKSRSLVARESPFLAPGVQSIATLSGIAVQRAEGGICVNALGHAHPRYRSLLKEQIDEVTVGSFTTPRRAEALERIAHHTPVGLTRIQLYSGGTEAVEAAMRLAKSYTKKFEFLSFWGGFHGKTAGTLSL